MDEFNLRYLISSLLQTSHLNPRNENAFYSLIYKSIMAFPKVLNVNMGGQPKKFGSWCPKSPKDTMNVCMYVQKKHKCPSPTQNPSLNLKGSGPDSFTIEYERRWKMWGPLLEHGGSRFRDLKGTRRCIVKIRCTH